MSKWITFVEVAAPKSHKTRVWRVVTAYSNSATALGDIRWYAPWRCYSYFPRPDTLYERQCLRDIALFCEQQTNDHRAKLKNKRANTREQMPPHYGGIALLGSSTEAKTNVEEQVDFRDMLRAQVPILIMAHTEVQLQVFARHHEIPRPKFRRIGLQVGDSRGFSSHLRIIVLQDWQQGSDIARDELASWRSRGGKVIELTTEQAFRSK